MTELKQAEATHETRVLTVHQPYATLIWAGVKRYETRTQHTNFRQPIFIHASRRQIQEIDRQKAIAALNEAKVIEPVKTEAIKILSVTGAIICQANLTGSFLMTNHSLEASPKKKPIILISEVPDLEKRLGFWKSGNHAWQFDEPSPCRVPIPATGRQGFWKPPAEMIEMLEDSLIPF